MKIALCQINPTVGSFEDNKNIIIKYYREGIELNADIIVFPELCTTGYPPQDLLWENGFVEENLRSPCATMVHNYALVSFTFVAVNA